MSAEGGPRRGRLWGALALLVLLGAGLAWWLLGRGPRLRPEPLENVPGGAVAVARIELGAVMRSSLWRHFVSARGGDAGLERLRERCGFDPADQVEELVVFVSGEEPDSLDHVTVLARGPFDHEALGGCMRTVLEEEGRGMRQVEIDGVPAVAGERGDSRVAFLGRDGAVFGHEDAVREVIATLQGERETAATDETLSDLWARVAHDRDVGVAARVPAHWREAATRRLEASPARGILAELASLEALGLGARVSRGLALGLSLRFDGAEAADGLGVRLEALKGSVLDDPLVALSPAGPAIRAIAIEPRGRELVVALDLDQERVDRLLELEEQLREHPERLGRLLGRPAPSDPRPNRRPAPLPRDPAPDETLRSDGD